MGKCKNCRFYNRKGPVCLHFKSTGWLKAQPDGYCSKSVYKHDEASAIQAEKPETIKCKDCSYFNEKARTCRRISPKTTGYLKVLPTDFCSRFAPGQKEDPSVVMSQVSKSHSKGEIKMKTCDRCKHYKTDDQTCHRFPPTSAGWAKTLPNDYCGELSPGQPRLPEPPAEQPESEA